MSQGLSVEPLFTLLATLIASSSLFPILMALSPLVCSAFAVRTLRLFSLRFSLIQSRRKELRSRAKVVPITLDQVYMLKVEGIVFRFLPDPVQIRKALEMKVADNRSGFDGVPVFQSELLVMKRTNKRYLPIFFRKEDLKKELTSKSSRGSSASQRITMSEKNSGRESWDDLIFVPQGRCYIQHIQEVASA